MSPIGLSTAPVHAGPASLKLIFGGSSLQFPIMPSVVVGRAQDCHVSINSNLVSRHHCEFAVCDGDWLVRDLGSRNGTFVNGYPVDKDGMFVDTGSRVKFGNDSASPELLVELPLSSTPPVKPDEVRPRVRMLKVEVHYAVQHENVKGMQIRCHIRIAGMKQLHGQLIAFFYRKDGQPLKDTNQTFVSSDGNVCVYSDFTPGFWDTTYQDFRLFIPYSELHLSTERADCFVRVQIFHKDLAAKWWCLATAADASFYWSGQPPAKPTAAVASHDEQMRLIGDLTHYGLISNGLAESARTAIQLQTAWQNALRMQDAGLVEQIDKLMNDLAGARAKAHAEIEPALNRLLAIDANRRAEYRRIVMDNAPDNVKQGLVLDTLGIFNLPSAH